MVSGSLETACETSCSANFPDYFSSLAFLIKPQFGRNAAEYKCIKEKIPDYLFNCWNFSLHVSEQKKKTLLPSVLSLNA